MKKSEAFKRENFIILIALIILFMITIALYFSLGISQTSKNLNENSSSVNSTNISESSRSTQFSTVKRVIDGDTFELDSGEKIRLICIDAPELGTPNSTDAKNFLERLIVNKSLILEKDVSETDKYGRLLRYVWTNDSGHLVFINKELIKNHLASLFVYGNDTKRCKEISLV